MNAYHRCIIAQHVAFASGMACLLMMAPIFFVFVGALARIVSVDTAADVFTFYLFHAPQFLSAFCSCFAIHAIAECASR